MRCPVCSTRPAEVGVLCEECRDELASPIKISQEQILTRVQTATTAALIDIWGRPHQLDVHSKVGRQVEDHGIAVLEPSVSRLHAELQYSGGAWSVKDLGSANGTYVEDKLVEGSMPVAAGERIRFGHIAFYLVDDVARLPPAKSARTVTTTIKPQNVPINKHAQTTDAEFEEESTDVGLPEMRFKLHEPTGGGGGLIEVDGKQVQLTTTQFELMALMIKRMAAEAHQPELVRGFVRSSELIADLSWDTREPSENHVKQLVRRVRRALMKSEIGDLIESRHRFGYRLRAIPKSP
ncbi:MAG TPA: FHA domain-containing protein [Kofleriaceae bacterium]|nr:FHA domain-containing protein [Kofleriaceae bacterium]